MEVEYKLASIQIKFIGCGAFTRVPPLSAIAHSAAGRGFIGSLCKIFCHAPIKKLIHADYYHPLPR